MKITDWKNRTNWFFVKFKVKFSAQISAFSHFIRTNEFAIKKRPNRIPPLLNELKYSNLSGIRRVVNVF